MKWSAKWLKFWVVRLSVIVDASQLSGNPMSDSTAEAARREMPDTLRDEAIKRGYEWMSKNKESVARLALMNWDHALAVALYIEAYEAGWEARNTQTTIKEQ